MTVILELVRAEVEVDAVDKSGFSSLYLAAMKGLQEACRILLENGANPNLVAKMSGGMTPIHACIFPKGSTEILQLMFEHRGDPNIQANSSDMAAVLRNMGSDVPMLVSFGNKIQSHTQKEINACVCFLLLFFF